MIRLDILEQLVLVNDLDAMFVGLLVGILAHASEMRVHYGWSCRVTGSTRTALAVDLQSIGGHVCTSAAGARCCTCAERIVELLGVQVAVDVTGLGTVSSDST